MHALGIDISQAFHPTSRTRNSSTAAVQVGSLFRGDCYHRRTRTFSRLDKAFTCVLKNELPITPDLLPKSSCLQSIVTQKMTPKFHQSGNLWH
jgi:hypothetical protein